MQLLKLTLVTGTTKRLHSMAWGAFLMLFVALAPSAAWAQKRVALVIGNNNYATETQLSNPIRDAQLIGQALRTLGFSVEEKINLPRREMKLVFDRFVRQSAGAESAVIYYAGHGAQPSSGGRNFLIPVDAVIDGDDTLESDAIEADWLVQQMERISNPARLRLVVLDACRNSRSNSRARGGERGLAPPARTEDATLIAYATESGQIANDGDNGDHSPYAKALAKYLAQADQLPLRRVFELTADEVKQATKFRQRPRTYGDMNSLVRLDGTQINTVAQHNQTGLSAQAELHAWQAVTKANTPEAYAAYLEEYPKGEYAAAARVARTSVLQPAARQTISTSATTSASALPPATSGKLQLTDQVPKRVALVVGNAKYKPMPPLINPVNDANLISKSLSALGFDVLTLNNLKRVDFLNALQRFRERSKSADLSFVYFAGHGVAVNGQNYLIPVDANIGDTADLSFQTVNSAHIEGNAGLANITVIDAASDNPFASRQLARVKSMAGTLVSYSSADGTSPLDGDNGYGPYAQALARYLLTPGLSIEQIFKQTSQAVNQITKGAQTPRYSVQLFPDIALSRAQ